MTGCRGTAAVAKEINRVPGLAGPQQGIYNRVNIQAGNIAGYALGLYGSEVVANIHER